MTELQKIIVKLATIEIFMAVARGYYENKEDIAKCDITEVLIWISPKLRIPTNDPETFDQYMVIMEPLIREASRNVLQILNTSSPKNK